MINIVSVEVDLTSIEIEVSVPPYKNIAINIIEGNFDSKLMEKFYYEWDKVWSHLLKWPDSDIKYIPIDSSTVRYDSSRAEVNISRFSDNAVVCVLLAYEADSHLFVELDVKTWDILHVYIEGDSGN